jgi:invasion protein IalB
MLSNIAAQAKPTARVTSRNRRAGRTHDHGAAMLTAAGSIRLARAKFIIRKDRNRCGVAGGKQTWKREENWAIDASQGRHVVAVIGEETACGRPEGLGRGEAADRARAGGKGSVMKFRIAFAPARPAARLLAVTAATAALGLATVAVHAQTPPPAAPTPAAPAKKAQPKQPAKQPAAQAPAPAPAQPGVPGAPGAPPAAAAGQPQQIPLVYSQWIKLCGKNPQDPNAKELCQTMKEAHMESGQFVAAAALIEMAGEQKKILQLILPTRLLLPPGTRVTVDSNPPSDGPFIICAPEFCMSQHEVTDDFVAKLKAGQTLQIQAINDQKQTVSYLLPLGDFAKAHDGPPTDPKVLEEQRKEAQKKMQDELLKRGEEAQKKMQAPATK